MDCVGQKLNRDFYLRPTLQVARDLIGKVIIYKPQKSKMAVKIVEVEAYIGEDDPACHAAVGKTERNAVMYGIGGFSYVYFIYGMYHCLNIVTENEDFPAAVLIRGGEPLTGLSQMEKNYPKAAGKMYTNGPGKLCKALNLTRDENGLDLLENRLYLEDRGFKTNRITQSARIGIKKGANRKWRFFDSDSDWVSANV